MDIESHQFEYLLEKYPVIITLKVCIREFRRIFENNCQTLLYLFIEKYRSSPVKQFAGFAASLERDLEAVKHAVSSPLSNGFVEGTNNKLKMVKRTMYGRCECRLLAAKLMVRI